MCETYLSLSVPSRPVTRFNALTRSATSNVLEKLFRSSTIYKAV